MPRITVADISDPPLAFGIEAVRAALERRPRRLAFAGRAGAGKTSVCRAISGINHRYPIINHADPIKEQVLAWLTTVIDREIFPGPEGWDLCSDFMGISPTIARTDLAYICEPLFDSLWDLASIARHEGWVIAPFVDLAPGEQLAAKVAFVDDHKAAFRTALQRYGQAMKELEADPSYWVKHTIERGIGHPICLNGDTRFAEEVDVLIGCGWVVIYLYIDDETQRQRLPYLTSEHLAHASEHSLRASHCSWIIDARQSLGKVLVDLGDILARGR